MTVIPPLYSAIRKKSPLSFFPRRELIKGAHGCASVVLEHMHYTSVYVDPPKDLWTPGTLLVTVLSRINPPIYLRSSPLLSHQTSWAVHQWLLLCSDSSLAYWCSHVISITLSLSHFWYITQLMTHSLTNQSCHAAYSFLYSAAYSCSLCLLIPAYPLLTDCLQTPYKALTNPWQILLTPFSFCTLMLCPPMYLNPWAQPSDQ